MAAYYNEIDPFAAAWLRELIRVGEIADGTVDERSVLDVQPVELMEFTQCHFFAGIGGWSRALRLAGWPDDKPCWTGSCPCQPFSAAGKRKGTGDDRHLWPHWFRLIRERRPATVIGEQVAAAIAHGWWDAVQHDLEAEGYACGMAVLPACSVGAFHIRQRLWFVGKSNSSGSQSGWAAFETVGYGNSVDAAGGLGLVAHSANIRCNQQWTAEDLAVQGERSERSGEHSRPKQDGELSGRSEGLRGTGLLDKAANKRFPVGSGEKVFRESPCGEPQRPGDAIGVVVDPEHPRLQGHGRSFEESLPQGRETSERHGSSTGATNGFWSNAEWLYCRDGKFRPVESVSEPMVDGLFEDLGLVRDESGIAYVPPLLEKSRNRVGRLRGYGNAIVPELAAEFIRAFR